MNSRRQLAANSPSTPIQQADAVAEILSQALEEFHSGNIDLRTCGTLGYLSSALLNAIEKGNLAQRVAALEAVIARQLLLGNTAFGDNAAPAAVTQCAQAPDGLMPPDDPTSKSQNP